MTEELKLFCTNTLTSIDTNTFGFRIRNTGQIDRVDHQELFITQNGIENHTQELPGSVITTPKIGSDLKLRRFQWLAASLFLLLAGVVILWFTNRPNTAIAESGHSPAVPNDQLSYPVDLRPEETARTYGAYWDKKAPAKRTYLTLSASDPSSRPNTAIAESGHSPAVPNDQLSYPVDLRPEETASTYDAYWDKKAPAKRTYLTLSASDPSSSFKDYENVDVRLLSGVLTDKELSKLASMHNIFALDLLQADGFSVSGIRALAKSKTLKIVKFRNKDTKKIPVAFSRGGWRRFPDSDANLYCYYRN